MSLSNAFILLFQSRDQKGIVAAISDAVYRAGGNIITADQYTTDPAGGHFFIRVEFMLEDPERDLPVLEAGITHASAAFSGNHRLFRKDAPLRMGIFLSRTDHCLAELLYLWRAQELPVAIPFIASNCDEHEGLAQQYQVPFYHIPATRENRREGDLLALASEQTDFLVLARYMLVLSRHFLDSYGKDVINIHHGLLPAFKGRDPYQQAFDHGVKVIGATAHFVAEALDEGAIIGQLTEQVSHKDHPSDLARKGRNLEKRALAQAVEKYVDYRVIRFGNKTIIF